MKRILVTGGTGFIGSNLVRRLLNKNHKLYLFTEQNPNLWRLHDIKDKLSIHHIDLTEYKNIERTVQEIKPEQIFHLASFGGMPHDTTQTQIYNVNFTGTLNLYNACKKVGFEVFINTGSSSEYGKKNVPMHEDLVLEPLSDYAVSKAASTQFCLKEALFEKLPVYTVRPFSVYGDAELGTRLIPTVIRAVLENKPLKLSSPHLVRDFIYIDDMVDALLAVAEKKPSSHFVFNAGTGVQSCIQDVVDAVAELSLNPLSVEWGKHTPRPWEPACWQADISRSEKTLDWNPKFTLKKGLLKTHTWFKNNLELYGERLECHGPSKQAHQSRAS